MDFIILKVNGEDLSSASHEQILQVFKSAQDPIIVEVARRTHKSSSAKSSKQTTSKSDCDMADLSISMPTCSLESVNPYATTILYQQQSYDSPKFMTRSSYITANDPKFGLSSAPYQSNPLQPSNSVNNCIDLVKINGILEEEEDDDDDCEEEQVQIIKEEVILRKEHPREIFGLTLSYSALAANDNSESEVYISAIESDSVASKHPEIRVGDQILQINNIDVHSKAQVVSLFQSCGLEVHMLLGRPTILPKKGGINNKSNLFNCDLPPVEEAEYSSVYDDVGSCKDKNKYMPQLDKDSGIGRGTDETAKTEESSECDSTHTSLRKSSQFSSLDSAHGLVDMHQISLLMHHLATEYNQLHKLLKGPSECTSPRIQALPPPTLNQSSSRVVPRMGTKLEPPQMKLTNVVTPAANGSNTSAYSTGIDSTRSSPLTMEFGPTINSTSLLSLKLDPFSNGRLPNLPEDIAQLSSSFRKKLISDASYDQKSASSSFAGSETLDPRMATSSIMIHNNNGTDNECHYYDVYDPATVSNDVNCRYDYEILSPSHQAGSYLDHDYINAAMIKSDRNDSKMEWVVKKRPDGTRYITRRPIRDKMTKDRSRKVTEERNGITTEEEENCIDGRMTKYLCKAEKKRHLDKPKEKKHKRRENASSLQSDHSTNSPSMSRSDIQSLNRLALRDVFDQRAIDQQKSYNMPTFVIGSTMF